jgi:hypothetical protein
MSWPRVTVMAMRDVPRSDEESYWHALWEGEANSSQPLGEFDGTYEEALAWAKARRPTETWVYDLELRDIVRL